MATKLFKKSKQDAGYSGITSDTCFNTGGCYDESNDGPWCFKPDEKVVIPSNNSPSQCGKLVSTGINVTDVGFNGMTKEQCQLVGGCYSFVPETRSGCGFHCLRVNAAVYRCVLPNSPS
jgi:hypothetical protein